LVSNHHPPVSFGTAQARNLVLICLLLATCNFQTNKQIIHITCTYPFTKPFYARKKFEFVLQTPGLGPEHLNEKTVLFKFDLKTFCAIAHKTANCSCTLHISASNCGLQFWCNCGLQFCARLR